jgi:serine protease Do
LLHGGISYLGVGVAEITADRAKALHLNETYGVEVTSVSKESPAEKAGVKIGDVMLEYNGHRVEGVEQFIRLVRETPIGREVKLVVTRSGATQNLTATIGSRRAFEMFGPNGRSMQIPMPRIEMPDIPYPQMSWRSPVLGVEVEGLSSQLAEYFGVKEGVLVKSVIKDSAAEKAGVKAGDVIVKAGDKKITSAVQLTAAVRAASGQALPLTIMRNHQEMSLTATLEGSPARSRPGRPIQTIRGNYL